jgi:hypothetical protein
MAITLATEDVVVDMPEAEAKFVFEPMSVEAFLNLPMGREAIDQKVFLEAVILRLKSWEGVVDKDGNPVECSADNFKKIPGAIGMLIIKRYADASGVTEEFEKKFGELLKPNEASAT